MPDRVVTRGGTDKIGPAGPASRPAPPSFSALARTLVRRARGVAASAVVAVSAAAVCVLTLPATAVADEPQMIEAPKPARMGAYLGDYSFTGRDGKAFTLKEFAGGKPVLLSLVYTGCETTCSTISASLARAFKQAGGSLGRDFKALTVGFDTDADSPAKMEAYGRNFKGGLKTDAWVFAAADRAVVERLSNDLGFYYKRSGEGFEHFNLVSLIDAEGRLRRQVFGAEFDAGEIINVATGSLKLKGPEPPPEFQGLFGRLLLLCYTYDEKTGTYRIDYSFFVGVALAVVVQGLLVALAVYFVRGARRLREKRGLEQVKTP